MRKLGRSIKFEWKKRVLPYQPDYQMWKVWAYRNELNNQHLAKQLNLPHWIFRNFKETEAHILASQFKIDMANVLRIGFRIDFASPMSFKGNPQDIPAEDFCRSGCMYFLTLNLTGIDQVVEGKTIKSADYIKYPYNMVHQQLIRFAKPTFWMDLLERLKIEPGKKEYNTIHQLGEMDRIWQGLAQFNYNFEEILLLQQSMFGEVKRLISSSLYDLWKLKYEGEVKQTQFLTIDEAIQKFDTDFALKLPMCFITQMLLKKTNETYPLVDLEIATFPSGMMIDEDGLLDSDAIYGTEEHKEMIRQEINLCMQYAVQMLIRCWIAAGMFKDELRDYLKEN